MSGNDEALAGFARRLAVLVPLLPGIILTQRVLFIHQGWFDIETPVITAGLSHPWQNAWEAPYGLIWYAINIPLTWVRIPYWTLDQSWLLWVSVLDLAFTIILYRIKPRLVLPYAIVSVITWRQAPYNLSIYWLTGLALYAPWFLVLAILAKIPFGAPLTIWRFILDSPPLLSEWRYYGLMMAWWLLILYILARNRFGRVVKGIARLQELAGLLALVLVVSLSILSRGRRRSHRD